MFIGLGLFIIAAGGLLLAVRRMRSGTTKGWVAPAAVSRVLQYRPPDHPDVRSIGPPQLLLLPCRLQKQKACSVSEGAPWMPYSVVWFASQYNNTCLTPVGSSMHNRLVVGEEGEGQTTNKPNSERKKINKKCITANHVFIFLCILQRVTYLLHASTCGRLQHGGDPEGG